MENIRSRHSAPEPIEISLHERISTGQVFPLLRLRNPWGYHEYTGPWSDHSKEWLETTESQRKELGLTLETDGEFW